MNIFQWIGAVNEYLGLPSGLLLMIAYQENGHNWNFRSNAINYNSGAKGAMQLTGVTIEQIRRIAGFAPNPFDLIQSIYGAGIYLKWLHMLFGDWRSAIAAYNSGLGTVRKIIHADGYLNENRFSAETKKYMFVADYLGL